MKTVGDGGVDSMPGLEHGDLSEHIRYSEWPAATNERAKGSVAAILNELADLGFAWRHIARLGGVSVPAVKKWRKGDEASGEGTKKLASLLAACDLIVSSYTIEDVASWFEAPLSSSAPVMPIDLLTDGRPDLLFEFANGYTDPEAILSQFDPDWRERYRSDFEVFEASDGIRSVRQKG